MWGILWSFRKAGWHFRRQVQIGPFYVDFACLGAKVAIEVDGDTHGTDEAKSRDVARDAYLESRGFIVLRFWNVDVMSGSEGVWQVVADVLNATLETGNTPTPSLPARGRKEREPRRDRTILAVREAP
jgi:very-short-patch-repair endonuclease